MPREKQVSPTENLRKNLEQSKYGRLPPSANQLRSAIRTTKKKNPRLTSMHCDFGMARPRAARCTRSSAPSPRANRGANARLATPAFGRAWRRSRIRPSALRTSPHWLRVATVHSTADPSDDESQRMAALLPGESRGAPLPWRISGVPGRARWRRLRSRGGAPLRRSWPSSVRATHLPR